MTDDWLDRKSFWRAKRVMVTGGAGFLGTYVVQKLRERGAAEIIVPRSRQYDLRDISAIRQLFRDATQSAIRNSPSAIIVIHLAARVGGILAQIGTPACVPKPRGKTPGWPKGRSRTPASRYPIVKKSSPKAD